MVGKSEANFVFLSARRGAEAAAQELSSKHKVPIEVVWLTPQQEDAAAQSDRISRATKEGFNAILVACSDVGTLTPAIDNAVDHGVAVMTFDSDAPASKRFAFYGADDSRLGELVMTELADLLHGKGRVAILAGNPDAPNLRIRAEGVRKAAAKMPGIEVVETVHHKETPQAAAAEVLRVNAARPDLTGWAMVGGWPLFRSSLSPKVTEDLGRPGMRVVAVDGLPEELGFVERGLVPVLWAQPTYLWGKVGVETIVDKLLLKKSVPEKIPMPLVRVSRQNLGTWARQLSSWGFSGIPEDYLKLK
jgi:ribose transport system substrate-binding protein